MPSLKFSQQSRHIPEAIISYLILLLLRAAVNCRICALPVDNKINGFRMQMHLSLVALQILSNLNKTTCFFFQVQQCYACTFTQINFSS